MNHANKNLYQIGEVTKMLGVTRRMLLNYEDLGLLTPAYKNESSGFRYYSADNIVHIRIIKVLQGLGLSLSEINKYFNNTEKLEDVIERMTALRSQLDLCIAQLQLRQSQTSEPEIHFTTLPSFTAFCQEFKDSDLARKTEDLRKTFIEATKKYQLDTTGKMCTEVFIESASAGRYVIPVAADPDTNDEHIKNFHRLQLSVYTIVVHTKILTLSRRNYWTMQKKTILLPVVIFAIRLWRVLQPTEQIKMLISHRSHCQYAKALRSDRHDPRRELLFLILLFNFHLIQRPELISLLLQVCENRIKCLRI